MKSKIGRIDGRGNYMRKNLKVLLLSLIVAATMIPISAFADTTAEAANEAGTQAATESTTNSNNPKPEVKNGWVTENGSKYYYEDDKCVTGKQSIEGKNYFFSETGVLQTGWIPSGSSKMYAGTDGVRRLIAQRNRNLQALMEKRMI